MPFTDNPKVQTLNCGKDKMYKTGYNNGYNTGYEKGYKAGLQASQSIEVNSQISGY